MAADIRMVGRDDLPALAVEVERASVAGEFRVSPVDGLETILAVDAATGDRWARSVVAA